MSARLKVVPRTSNRPAMLYRAMIVYRKRGISAQRLRAYSTREHAIVGAMGWILRDGQAGAFIMIYHAKSGQEVANVKMTSLGNVRTSYPWGESKMR